MTKVFMYQGFCPMKNYYLRESWNSLIWPQPCGKKELQHGMLNIKALWGECMANVHWPWQSAWHMWCNLRNVWSLTCDFFSFLFDWSAHLERYILIKKNPPESDQWFQSYEQLKDSQNNSKTKESHSFFWLYLTINAQDFLLTDSTRLQHIICLA